MALSFLKQEIYDINNSSLKDAIVSFGGFCTGEIISSEGLLLTNHHCGYGNIQKNSTDENNYLRDGFWAMSKSEELPNEGLFARFFVRMDDVTEMVNAQLNDDMAGMQRMQAIRAISKSITDSITEGTHYNAEVKSFYHGNEFYVFVYETFNDVRLVGTPPESVGKFGGDTDNWMWPRHTGDFSMFRVYMAPDGKPAEYSEDNVPLKPKHHLPVSVTGVQPGDFTMIFGYPGSTDRYLTSFGVKQAIEKYNPSVVEVRDLKLSIMRKHMNANPSVDLAYSSKYASTANYWKYYIGQTEQLKNNNVFGKKQKIESDFEAWANADENRKAKYGETLTMLKEAYEETDPVVKNKVYALEAGLIGADITLFAFRMGRTMEPYLVIKDKVEAGETEEDKERILYENKEAIESALEAIKASAEEHFKGYSEALNHDLLAALTELYAKNIDKDQQPAFMDSIRANYNGDFNAWADSIFANSFLANKERFMAMIEGGFTRDDVENDLGMQLGSDFFGVYRMTRMSGGGAEEKKDKGIVYLRLVCVR